MLKHPPCGGVRCRLAVAPRNFHQLDNYMSKCFILLLNVIVVGDEDERIVEGTEVVGDDVVVCRAVPSRAMVVERISQSSVR
jgi:hypothetical protein